MPTEPTRLRRANCAGLLHQPDPPALRKLQMDLSKQDLFAAFASRETGMMPIIRTALELTELERELAFGLMCTMVAWRPQNS